jgi:hypothetical protein
MQASAWTTQPFSTRPAPPAALFFAKTFSYTSDMLNKVLGGAVGLAGTATVSFFVAWLQSPPNTSAYTFFEFAFPISLGLAIAATIGWFATRRHQDASSSPIQSAAIVGSDNASLVNPTAVHQTGNINVGTINVQSPTGGPPPHPIPILDFSDPISDDIAIVDQAGHPHSYVRIWRVELRNLVEGTEATDVEVALSESVPPVSTFPVDLHRFHDDNSPYAKRHNLRHNAPIIFDVIAKRHDALEFYLWRSDLPRPQYTYIYPLSLAEHLALFANDHAIIVLRAAAAAPVRTKERAYGISIDDDGELLMEPLALVPLSFLTQPSNTDS